MPGTLFVAAGGGGDAPAALIVGRAAGVVAGFSWDRYVLDPTPGPRFILLDPADGLRAAVPVVSVAAVPDSVACPA